MIDVLGAGSRRRVPAKRAIGNVIANTELLEMAMAYGQSCVLCAAARLGVGDALGDAERSASEVAKACRADASSMYRLLRAMAALGLLEETQQQRFRLTEMGRPLRKDMPDSSWAAIVFWADLLADFWSHLGECVRTGQNAQQVMDKAGIASRWSQVPEANAIFRAVMGTAPAEDYAPIVDACTFPVGGVSPISAGAEARSSAPCWSAIRRCAACWWIERGRSKLLRLTSRDRRWLIAAS